MRKLYVAAAVLVIGCSVRHCSLALADHGSEATKHVERHHAGVPLLENVPYISRVFKNIGTGDSHGIRIIVDRQGAKTAQCRPHDCPKQVCGIDVDVVKGKSAKPSCNAQCKVGAAPDCCKKGTVVANRKGCGKRHEVAAKAKCVCGDACNCTAKCACGDACKCAPAAKRDGHKKTNKLIAALRVHEELRGERAEMFEDVLELREDFEGERAELIEALAEAKAEIAHLRAHVELAQQKHELLQSVMTTATENARLKAQLEFVSHGHQTQQTLARITAENAKLKAHLTKLEAQIATKQREAQTARAPRETRHKQ